MARDPVGGRVAKRSASVASRSGVGGRRKSSTSAKTNAVLQDAVDKATAGISASSQGVPALQNDTEMGGDTQHGTKLGGASQPQRPCGDAPLSPQPEGSRRHAECPIVDADEKPFPLMRLPPEIRNEVYRACLTRPFHILLAKNEPPPPAEREDEGSALPNEGDDEDEASDEDMAGEFAVPAVRQTPSMMPPDASSNRPLVPCVPASASSSNIGRTTAGESPSQVPGLRAWASRSARHIRFLTSPNSSNNNGSSSSSSSNSSSSRFSSAGTPVYQAASVNTGVVLRPMTAHPARPMTRHNAKKPEAIRTPRPQDEDPLLINILRVSKQVYQEARAILYSENLFTLDLDSALPTLAVLHQRSRRQIKHVELEIPCYNEILERFQETVRLSLRYCWGLKKLVIHMSFTLPGMDGSGTATNTTVYANGFDILRWLPRQCEVVLKGNVCAEIRAVVSKNANLAKTLDELAYARRQLISLETLAQPAASSPAAPPAASNTVA